MDFELSDKGREYLRRLGAFMDEHIYPNEARYYAQHAQGERWQEPALLDELQQRARAAGLWNLFLPDSRHGAGLTNLEYAPLCELMGRVRCAPEVFNCAAPDTGNMETLERYGTPAQKQQWLEPLLAGAIRSAFAMTEPRVASSDATNIESSIVRDGDAYVHQRPQVVDLRRRQPALPPVHLHGQDRPAAERHRQQSMILVPRETPGITILRHLPVFGFDDAPHGHMEIDFKDVRVPAAKSAARRGAGLRDRPGTPGSRAHPSRHAPDRRRRARAREDVPPRQDAHRLRAPDRRAVGDARAHRASRASRIDQARLLVYKAAWLMDTVGNKAARAEIAMIKIAAADTACRVVDWAIQAHGAGGPVR